MPAISLKPTWAKHEKDIHSSNLETAVKASEAFTAERDLELRTSRKARMWEEDRKAESLKEKPQWVKKKRAQETELFDQTIKSLKQGVNTKLGVTPLPGYVLVRPIVEQKTESGLYLPGEINLNTNTGTVVAVGAEDVTRAKVTPPPCEVGDTVMFKKGLPGLEMTVQSEFCLLMRWEDLLAVLK